MPSALSRSLIFCQAVTLTSSVPPRIQRMISTSLLNLNEAIRQLTPHDRILVKDCRQIKEEKLSWISLQAKRFSQFL